MLASPQRKPQRLTNLNEMSNWRCSRIEVALPRVDSNEAEVAMRWPKLLVWGLDMVLNKLQLQFNLGPVLTMICFRLSKNPLRPPLLNPNLSPSRTRNLRVFQQNAPAFFQVVFNFRMC
jgi:hypothetical protein